MLGIHIDEQIKEMGKHFSDVFSLCYTSITGMKLFSGFMLFSMHGFFEGVFFYAGGFFTVAWLAFRALQGYHEYKKAKNQ